MPKLVTTQVLRPFNSGVKQHEYTELEMLKSPQYMIFSILCEMYQCEKSDSCIHRKHPVDTMV